MAITNLEIIEGCISCGACEAAAPEVFEVKDVAEIRPGVDLNQYEEEIIEAADACPVDVIKYTRT